MLRLGKAIIAKYNKKYDQIMKFALNFLKFFYILYVFTEA